MLTAAVCVGCVSQSPIASEDAERPPVAVKTVAVSQQAARKTSTQPATVKAYFRAQIRARATGYVSGIAADIGDYVEQGDPLAVIAVPDLEKRREIAEANVVIAASEEKRAEAGVLLAEANVKSAEAKLLQAKSELDRADASRVAMEAEFQRTQELVQQQSIESRMLDEVRKKRDSERANKQAMASAMASSEAEVTVAQAKLTSAEADLQAAKAAALMATRRLEEMQVLVDFATLKAPFSGVVTARSIDVGDLVNESDASTTKPHYVVSQISKVRVHIPIPESDAAFVDRGDAVTIRFPSFAETPVIDATVTRIAGDLDPSTRTMLVEVELENPDNQFLPGMFGEATVTLDDQAVANVLPSRAIRFTEKGDAYVYVVGSDSSVTRTPITTGVDSGEVIEVLTGVESGQHVVDAHLQRFETGQKVALLKN